MLILDLGVNQCTDENLREDTTVCSGEGVDALIASVGADVTLPCRTTEQPYHCIWRLPQSPPIIPETNHSKYQLQNKDGDCSIVVKNISYTDQGRYQCIAVTEQLVSISPLNLTVLSKLQSLE